MMPLSARFAQRAAVCLVTTIAFVTVHELLHIAAGHWFGIGGHFTSLTSADSDPARAQAATAAARAWMAGGVDTATVLVGYFGVAGTLRGVLSVAGIAFTIASGYLLGGALGDRHPVSSAEFDAVPGISATRRVVGTAFVVLSICLIVTGTALLARPGRGNPMGPFLLADILWAVGMLTATPWRQPGPRFVRDVWLAPAIAAMGLLTLVGAVFPSDYAAAGLFFLPQLATAAYAARKQEFTEAAHAEKHEPLGIAARAV